MEWLDDSKACLDIAELMMDDLQEQIEVSIIQDDIIPYMKVTIKNILENCRSPLDYAANFIFDTYCRHEYNSKNEINKKRARKLQFPITKDLRTFESVMENKFKKLSFNQPFIVKLVEKAQPFNGDPWLDNLTHLVNTNKHRSLTKHHKNQNFRFKVLILAE